MKIRTNFVTNSSSYSSAEIKIDNPVLLEIMKKYKEQGAFVDEDDWDRGSMMAINPRKEKEEHLYYNPCIEKAEVEEELKGMQDEEIAFYYLEEEQADVFYAPDKVEDVVKCILKIISWDDNVYFKNGSLYKKFKGELVARASEINDSYREVYWEANNDGYGESEPEEGEETNWHFEYHK